MNNRRNLIVALGAGVLTAPFGLFAQQQSKVWRVGFLAPRRMELVDTDFFYGTFRLAMRELGYVDGKNLVIEWRAGDGKAERLPGLAAELVALKVDAIVAWGSGAVAAAQKATSTIPIVMGTASEVIGTGFVKNLARPGGNITGLTNLSSDLSPKHLELLHSMVPKVSRVGVFLDFSSPASALILRSVQAAAQKLGLKVLPLESRTPEEIEKAFSVMTQQKAGAFIVPLSPLFSQQTRQMAELARTHRLPSISAYSGYVEAGGLMSYGQNLGENLRRAAIYLDKIFKGAKPADLPVEQPTILEMVLNMKTAKALGIKIPQSILVQATKVIE